jgi:hypothetical protein
MFLTFGRAPKAGAAAVVCLLISLASARARADVSVCVEVRLRSWSESGRPRAEAKKPAVPAAWQHSADPARLEQKGRPNEFDPAAYLRRMLEYEVTHEPGYHSTRGTCSQRMEIELYPLATGWTVFGRYSGFAREEKLDLVELDEFPQLAQRLAFALLRDRPVQETITRENVLRADSEHAFRTIRTRGHALLAIGTSFRAGELDTASDADAPVSRELRVLTPVSFQLGYRGKFKSWGLDVFGRLSLGARERAPRNNELGGHVDFAGAASLGLHFLRYLDPAGMTSFYFGGGASFDLSLFSVIRPESNRDEGDRDYLLGAGLNLDLLFGYEFLRASSLHFFGQLEIAVPTYAVKTESSAGSVDTYLPGGLAQIGVLF